MFASMAEKVSSQHTALLVVDVQNDFCHKVGACAKSGMDMGPIQKMLPTLTAFIDKAREAGVSVIFIRNHSNEWTDSESLIEQRKSWALAWPKDMPFKINTPDSWGSDFFQVKPTGQDHVVTKHRYSAFINTDLDLILRSQGIKTVVMSGVATNVCVESTARHAFMLDYYVIFVEDCCGTSSPQHHQATLSNIREHFGTVVKAEEVSRAWRVG